MPDPSVDLVQRNRSFAAYWLGQTVAGSGHEVTVIALPLVSAITLDAGPAAVGAVASAAMLPYLLFSLVVGHILEGRDQKRVMIPADLAQAILLTAVPIAWAMGWLSVPLLIVIAFLTGVAAVAFGVSGFAYLPSLVEERELAAANRAVQGSGTVAEVARPGLAGLLVSWLGPPVAILADSLSYLASALGVARSNPLPRAHVEPMGSESKPSITTGLKILFQNRYLRALTLHAALFNLAEQIFFLNLVIWAVQRQDVSAVGYGLALSTAGVGGLLGTITALRVADRLGLGRAFAASLVLSCVVPLFTAMWPLEGLSLALVIGAVMFVSGIGLGNANVYSLTLRQIVIPNTQHSRSAGAYTQVMYGSIPIGSALAGVIGSTLGPRAGVAVGALGLLVSILPMLTRPVLTLHTAESARPT